MGITSILKHKKDAKEQAQLVRQLTAHTRRLEHIVSDLGDAETLVHGTIELTVRRTDLETLVRRVVEESGVDADHEVVIHADRLVVAVDPLRTEQILAGLLRASGDRTPAKKTIVIRLEQHEDGAMITVSDPEPSSDASMSPVVQRFAEAQAGWAKVEGREEGGSSFKVYLPDGAGIGEPAGPTRDVKVVVDTPRDDWEHSDGSSMLVQELHRLSTAEEN
jgi:K+-sensing histidine kinase KdpD